MSEVGRKKLVIIFGAPFIWQTEVSCRPPRMTNSKTARYARLMLVPAGGTPASRAEGAFGPLLKYTFQSLTF